MESATILVVEDEPSIGEVVSLDLKRAGYVVSVVRDGEAALGSLARQLPNLLVLDLMLPKVDCLEITRWLCGRGDTPIISSMRGACSWRSTPTRWPTWCRTPSRAFPRSPRSARSR